jgi:hypothetical protein
MTNFENILFSDSQFIRYSTGKIFSQENTMTYGEKAVKIHRTPSNSLTNIEVVDYYLVHNSKPYDIQDAVNVKHLKILAGI